MAQPEAITRDTLLGGQVTLRQHAAGYRVAMDPVLLSASIPAAAGEAVLDVGAGVGAAMLCLAWRVSGIKIFGVEVQSDLVHLAAENIADNGLAERLEVDDRRFTALAAPLGAAQFRSCDGKSTLF